MTDVLAGIAIVLAIVALIAFVVILADSSSGGPV